MSVSDVSTENATTISPQCPNVITQCKRTILDNPVQLITLVVCSLGVVYILDVGIQWTLEQHHYKARGVRRTLLEALTANLLLFSVFVMGVDNSMDVNIASVLLLSGMVMSVFSMINAARMLEPLHAAIFVAIQSITFYVFYYFSSRKLT